MSNFFASSNSDGYAGSHQPSSHQFRHEARPKAFTEEDERLEIHNEYVYGGSYNPELAPQDEQEYLDEESHRFYEGEEVYRSEEDSHRLREDEEDHHAERNDNLVHEESYSPERESHAGEESYPEAANLRDYADGEDNCLEEESHQVNEEVGLCHPEEDSQQVQEDGRDPGEEGHVDGASYWIHQDSSGSREKIDRADKLKKIKDESHLENSSLCVGKDKESSHPTEEIYGLEEGRITHNYKGPCQDNDALYLESSVLHQSEEKHDNQVEGKEVEDDGSFWIFISLETHKMLRIRVKSSDSIWALKGMIWSCLETNSDNINLHYHSTELIDDHPLSYYSIGPHAIIALALVPVPSPSISQLPFSSAYHEEYVPATSSAAANPGVNDPPSAILTLDPPRINEGLRPTPRILEYPYLAPEEAKRRIDFCWSQAEIGHFDPDTEIVDPEAHYSLLEYLERNVIQESEYSRCRGIYSLRDNVCVENLTEDSRLPDIIPDAVWQEVSERLVPVLGPPAGTSQVNEDESRSLARGFKKSLILLRNLVINAYRLIDSRFLTDFFSLLVDEGGNVARLTTVPISMLRDLLRSLSNAIWGIYKGNLQMNINDTLKTNVYDRCVSILGEAQFKDRQLDNPSMAHMLDYCRSTMLLLDLALMSYVGCHASDLPHIPVSPAVGIHIPFFDNQVVVFSWRPLACLENFVGTGGVWVFQPPRVQQDNYRNGSHNDKLTILCQMRVFADVWGPVWSNMDGKGGIQQHNLSAGCIRQTARSYHHDGAVSCHWIRDQHTVEVLEFEQRHVMNIDDFLLIGAGLQRNVKCRYTIDQYEIDFQHTKYRKPLKTSEMRWRLETRTGGGTAGVSAGPVNIGVTGQIAQKKIPKTTQKQALWRRWDANPESANIGWLNNFSGVELSHCTNNIRRIRARHLLRLKPVKDRLNELSGNWEATAWGAGFIQALDTEDSKKIFDFWSKNLHFRKELGGLLRQFLELLIGTGTQNKQHFIAAYFKNYASEDRQMEIPIDGNEWARRCRDTRESSVLAVVSDACLKCKTKEIGWGECNQRQKFRTMYETRTRVNRRIPERGSIIRLDSERFIVGEVDPKRRQITLSFPPSGLGFGSTVMTLREVINVNSDTDSLRGEDWKVLILAAKRSFGGMMDDLRNRQEVEKLTKERRQRESKKNKKQSCCVIL